MQIFIKISLSIFCFLFSIISISLNFGAEKLDAYADKLKDHVKVYPAPSEIELSQNFQVEVEGIEVPLYKAIIPPEGPIPRLSRDASAFGIASYGSWDMNDKVNIEVTYPTPIESFKILPTSFGIEAKVDGRKLSFTLGDPRHLTIEINGDWHESLHLFANPFEENIPDPDDPNVIFYEAGVHEVVNKVIGDNTTVYIAGGAYIKGITEQNEEKMVAMNGAERFLPTFILDGKNIEIRGRGIIDQQHIKRSKRRYTILVKDSEDIKIEGIIIHDPSHWTIPIKRSKNLHIDNIKIIGWRGNSDGVDISSSTKVLVENCFFRTLDDLVVVKSRTGQGEARDIHVRKCVLWNELAHALSIGAELRENVSDVLFEDCDVIHDVGRETALRVYHCDDGLLSNIRFENIRVEEARRLISVWIGKTRWTKTPERGNIRGVIFKDIVATSAPIDTSLTGFQDGSDWKPYIIRDHASMEIIGYDVDHTAEDIMFENVVLDGKVIKKEQITINEFVKNVKVE
ncbi:glycosyl hydrolase family 28 protein [Portibacter lacus]|uniref:Endo-polygalacturonase n=1 Tax=Portibacter lacus TaxID=1099794 RepID=A0AA37SRX8_9BACT|nr:glycosyl hydrolase family 28 protein [Portibacter lacus]GLR18459.1 hypothetical protein GCM10007940_30750 [Portibacter lacus]